MGSKPFQFKHFTVAQDRCSHKVGTDGVLLGAWVNINATDRHILDIGTGSGLIALMLAQRSPASTRIDAIDISAPDVQQARENVQHSPWPEKIDVHVIAIQSFFPPQRYNLIISNPPFFEKSLPPPDVRRTLARHTRHLSFQELVSNASRLLAPDGRLAVIVPYVEGLRLVGLAEQENLHVLRKTTFRARAHKPPERLLIEFSPAKGAVEETDIVLYAGKDEWSEPYQSLTRDFYLKSARSPRLGT